MMTNFQIGAQMYSLRDRCKTYDEMLETMKALKGMGYNTIQFSGHGQDITAQQLKDLLDETGMTCGSTHIGLKDLEDDIERVIDEHRMWGCNYPGIGGGPQNTFKTEEGVLEFCRTASKIADRLLKDDMHFVYHNHAVEMTKLSCGKNVLEIMLENCSPAVQFELDLFWVQMSGGSPIDYLERFAGHMDVVHFKEMNGTFANNNVMAPIGMGNLNWPKIMAACDAIGVKYAFIEQDNAVESDSLECMRISHDNLAAMGGKF